MNTQYLMQYAPDDCGRVVLKLVEAPVNSTDSKLQEMFVAEYLRDHIKFYLLGSEVTQKENK